MFSLVKSFVQIIITLTSLLLYALTRFDFRCNDKTIFVKYGRLGDVAILMNAVRVYAGKIDWDSTVFYIPQQFHPIFLEYYPDALVRGLPSYRESTFSSICFYVELMLLVKPGRVFLLGGSRSPLEEDIFAACCGRAKIYGDIGDLTKTNKFSRFVSSIFYTDCVLRSATHEYELLCMQFESAYPLFKCVNINKFSLNDLPIDSHFYSKIGVFFGASSDKRSLGSRAVSKILSYLGSKYPGAEVYLVGSRSDFKNLDIEYFVSTHKHDIVIVDYLKTVAELFKFIDSCDYLVVNDSAPLHISRFLGKPTFVVSGEGHFTRFVSYSGIRAIGSDCNNIDCCWRCVYPLDRSGKFKCVSEIDQIDLGE